MSAASMKVFASRVEHGGYVSSHGSPISHSPELSARKSDSNLRGSSATLQLTEALARLTPSVSNHERNLYPCFFHRRFQDAVNIDKILRELTSDDDDMSHSKLSQSAIAVREVSKHLQRRPLKRAVRNVMIITKARDNSLVNLTHELTDWLLRTPRYGNTVGVNVYVDKKLQHSKRFNAPGLIAGDTRFSNMLRYWTPDLCSETPHKFDLVLTLGGDGTVLFTSKLFQRVVPPVLSFSMGSLGFLTPFEFGNYQEDLNRVMGGVSKSGPTSNNSSSNTLELTRDPGMRVNLRMRFTCTLHRVARKSIRRSSNHTTVEELQHYEVLNELVIDRGPSPYVSNLELYGDDDLLTVIQADGVIFSTPTGSTAYSLSAGGALVHPDIPAILLTPICPHTLSFRPMLLNDTMTLRVSVPKHSRATAYCSFDGKNRLELRQGDYVTIVASRYPFPMVVGETKNEWIDSVSKTLRWNTREAVQRGWEEGKRRNRASRVGVAPVGVRDYLKGSMWNMHPQEGDEDDEGDEEGEEEACTEDDDHDEDDDERFDIDFDDESALASAASRDSGFADNMSMSQAGAMSPPPSNRGPL